MHPFVKKAIDQVALGRPKPIWFDAIVVKYPPVIFSSSNAKSMFDVAPSSKNRWTNGPSKGNAPSTDLGSRSVSSRKGFKAEGSKSSLKKGIEFPEDVSRMAYYAASSFNALKHPLVLTCPPNHANATSSNSPEVEAIITLGSSYMESNRDMSMVDATHQATTKLVATLSALEIEEKLAAEQALYFNHVS